MFQQMKCIHGSHNKKYKNGEKSCLWSCDFTFQYCSEKLSLAFGDKVLTTSLKEHG